MRAHYAHESALRSTIIAFPLLIICPRVCVAISLIPKHGFLDGVPVTVGTLSAANDAHADHTHSYSKRLERFVTIIVHHTSDIASLCCGCG